MATDVNDSRSKYISCGYEFMSEEDAQKAEMDLQKIGVLKARFKNRGRGEMKAVYEKAIENKIFKTPVGWGYLMELRTKLIESGISEEDLIPIPLNISMTRHSAIENLSVKQRIKPERPPKNVQFGRVFPIVLNIILAILVIVMFIIVYNSDSDNIVNYRRNITNRYSAWEQDLSERERKVRLAERELGIQDTSEFYNESAVTDD